MFAYDAATLRQQAVWCSTPNGSGAGVWQSGAGLTADDEGDVYLMTGNGDVDPVRHNFGESFVKLSSKDLSEQSFFTPWNWNPMNNHDSDLGSAGPVCISGTQFVIGAGKPGRLYCLNRQNLGGLGNSATNTNNSVDEVQATRDPPHPNPDTDHHVHCSPVYFDALSRIYVWGENDLLRAYLFDRLTGRMSHDPVAIGTVMAANGMPGGMLSLSSNGVEDAVLWSAMPLDGDSNRQRLVDGVLRVFDPQTLNQIWDSTSPNDQVGHFAKFVAPTVANRRAYVATYDGKVVVYGLS